MYNVYIYNIYIHVYTVYYIYIYTHTINMYTVYTHFMHTYMYMHVHCMYKYIAGLPSISVHTVDMCSVGKVA